MKILWSAAATARAALPTGQTLPDADWSRRHRLLLVFLWAHAVAMPAYGALRGYEGMHLLLHGLPIAAFGGIAMLTTKKRRTQSLALAMGLLTASALAVHSSHGVIEAHFHFFVVVVILTMYEDWTVFLAAVGYVVLHHGVLGAIDRYAVYDHDGGNPWMWAAIHGGFVLAAGIGAIVAWRLNEDVRTRAGEVEERFRRAFDDAAIGMALTSLDGHWMQVNRALCELTGHPEEALVGMRVRDVTHPDDIDADLEALDRLRRGEIRTYACEKRYVHADGTPVWVALNVSAVHGPHGPVYLIAQTQDITERRRVERELAHQAMHDTLTGLPNRALFMDRLGVAVSRLDRRLWPLSVMFVDLDRFKLVNDSLGHPAGDRLLIEVSQRLRGAIRSGDTIARFAGDEFTILCEDLVDGSEASLLADRIIESLRAPFWIDGHEIHASASIGLVVAHGSQPHDAEDILRNADVAMYRAKERGASRYEVFHEGMHARSNRLEFESELRHALERSELRLHYQTEVSLTTRAVVGVEALVRWEHPTRGLVAPDQFVPAAEANGLIVPIGAWVLRESCRQMAAWRAAGHFDEGTRIAVNVAPRQLAEPDFVEVVELALEASGLPPGDLVLEVTETALLDDTGAGIRTLEKLKTLGVRLALDDFGVGFSSLGRVKDLPAIDLVKIDRSFIAGLGTSVNDAAIVSSVIKLAESLGVDAIAEGVETVEHAERLQELGCPLAQGFFFSRPVAAEHVGGNPSRLWTASEAAPA